jgi:hypothetical protein
MESDRDFAEAVTGSIPPHPRGRCVQIRLLDRRIPPSRRFLNQERGRSVLAEDRHQSGLQ